MRSSAVVTMGVKEELLLLDSGTGAVVPRAGEVLDLAAASGMDLQGELTQTQVETATPVCRDEPAPAIPGELLQVAQWQAARDAWRAPPTKAPTMSC